MALASGMLGILDGIEVEDDFEDTDDEEELERFIENRNYLYSYLVNTQSSETLSTIVDVEEGDARAVWERLLQQYESSSKASLKHLIYQLVEMKQGSKSIAEFVSAVMESKRRIEDIASQSSISIMDEISMMVLIQGLPNSMQVIRSQLFLDDSLTLEKCKRQIIDSSELLSLKKAEGTALRTNDIKKDKKCDHKNHPGGADNCWILHPELRPKKRNNKKYDRSASDNTTQDVANRTVAQGHSAPDFTPLWNRHVKSLTYARIAATRAVQRGSKRFVVDSGSTDHFSNSAEGLDNFIHGNSMKVAVANGEINHTSGVGDINGKIKSVHVMESFQDNLLSVPKLYEDNKIVLFSPEVNGVLIAQANDFKFSCRVPLATGPYENGTFTVDIPLSNIGKAREGKAENEEKEDTPTITQVAGVPNRRLETIERWFRRTGYQNPDRLIQGMNHGLFKGVDLPPNLKRDEFRTDSCDAYQMGRQKAHPHYDRGGEKRSTTPYEVVHFDIKVANENDYKKHRYALVLVDDYTRYTHGILLRHKDDLVEELHKWHQQHVVRLGYKVKRFRCDNAGEQKSYEYDAFMTEIASKTEYTNAYSSASNGISERKIQTVWNTSQCIRVGAGFPRAAWGECFMTAVVLENLLPNSANTNNKSPHEMLFKIVPDLSFLKVPGTKAFVHVHKPKRVALDPKAEVGRMIGYALETNGYRILMDSQTGKVVETNHVTFAESVKDSAELLLSMPGLSPETEYYDAETLIPGSGREEKHRAILKLPQSRNKALNQASTMPVNVPITPQPTPSGDLDLPVVIEDDVPDDGVHEVEVPGVVGDVGEQVEPPQADGGDHVFIPDPVLEHLEEQLKKDYYQYFPRRSERQRHEPVRLNIPRDRGSKSYVIQAVARRVASKALSSKITHREALADKRLRESMLKEISHLFKIGAVEITDLPEGHKAIGNVWAHKLKYDVNGQFIKAKSRICPWGFDQIPGVSYDPNKVEAPTLRLETIMLMLTLTVNRGMFSRNADVDGAFTIPKNPHPTYMKPPKGLALPKGKVLKLNHTINGTKQAAYYWNEMMNEKLINMGFKRSILDPCLYYRWVNEYLSLIGLYVDDLRIVCDHENDLDEIENEIRRTFPIKIPPENAWLGMKIMHDKVAGTIEISSVKYIEELLETYHMSDSNPVSTPAVPGSKLKKREKPSEVLFPFRELVGNLLWLARTTRPDILYAVNQLCSHVLNYGEEHVIAAKRVLRYLKGSKELPLKLTKQEEFTLEAYADADFAGEPEENDQAMKSLSGMVAYIKGIGPIYSQSKLQSTVSTSTSEAELKAVGMAVQFILPIRQLLEEIGFKCETPTTIYNDNASCIASLKSKLSGSKLRHVKVNFQFVKEKISMEEIKVRYLQTDSMLADIMTKALHAPRFLYLRDILMNAKVEPRSTSVRHGGVSE